MSPRETVAMKQTDTSRMARMSTSRTSASPPARPLLSALDRTFKIGLVLKGLHAILEVAGILLEGILQAAGGILLLFFF
jgi:uncharacterized membrane protein